MKYTVRLGASAEKFIAKLRDKALQRRITTGLRALEDNPRPPGAIKMQGADTFRIRVGDYRILYEIHDAILVVLVVKIDHRGRVYR